MYFDDFSSAGSLANYEFINGSNDFVVTQGMNFPRKNRLLSLTGSPQ